MNFDLFETDVCIYHRNCADGFCCAWLVWRYLGNNGERDIEFHAMNPSTRVGDETLESFHGKNVLVVDLSLSKDNLIDIQKVARNIAVLDHHKTAEGFLKELDFAVFDIEECGASLLFKHIASQLSINDPLWTGPERPRIVDFVKDRDLWLWEEGYSHEVNALIQTLPFEFPDWNVVADQLDTNTGLEEVIRDGAAILKTQNRMADELARHANEVGLFVGPERHSTIKAKVVNCPVRELISMVGHRILEIEDEKDKDEKAQVAVMYSIFPDGGFLFSLRSVPSFDASVIASAWGGGGHKNACGFKGNVDEGLPWIFERS